MDRDIKLFKTGIPIAPAAHYFIGGVKSDLYGATNKKHLWGVGESASSGFHGANRLASNSLLECIVAPQILVNKLLESSKTNLPDVNYFQVDTDLDYYDEKNILNLLSELKNKNSNSLGLIRTKSVLSEHLNYLSSLFPFLNLGKLSLNYQVQELKNMVLLSFLICQAAIKRENSLGVHYRQDFPGLPNEFKHSVFCKNTEKYWLSHTLSSPAISNIR